MHPFRQVLFIIICSCGITGCSDPADVPLMPTPIIYQSTGISPLDGIPEEQRWNFRQVYYVTTRKQETSPQLLNYSNTPDDQVNVGTAMISFGGSNVTWSDLSLYSTIDPREQDLPLSIVGLFEAGSYRLDEDGKIAETQGATKWLLNQIENSIEDSRDKDLLIYVHGAKVNFYNACAYAAQLDHFMGRSMTSLAFSWPTRQNIIAYGFGGDRERAYQSTDALASVIEAIASQTSVRRIHILAWSAGGRVTTATLRSMRDRNPDMSGDELADKFKLGTVYFAAADVPASEFIDALPALNEMAEKVIVTASSNDGALKGAQIFMGGDRRIGLVGHTLTEEQIATVVAADRFEFIDMSKGAENRGFDITGHRYWFNHPWASTDALLSIRTDFDPEERGLEPTENGVVWWMPADYPERVKQIIQIPTSEMRR